MVKLKKGKRVSQPSSTIGLMRFNDSDAAGPKLSPEFVLVLTAVIAGVAILLHLFS